MVRGLGTCSTKTVTGRVCLVNGSPSAFHLASATTLGPSMTIEVSFSAAMGSGAGAVEVAGAMGAI